MDGQVALENACFRAAEHVSELIAAASWDAVGEALAADIRFEDRRPGLSWTLVGREKVVDHLRQIDMSGAEIVHTVLAVRGELLLLWRELASIGGFEVESLMVIELNEWGEYSGAVVFDQTALGEAIAELDHRFIAADNDTPALRLMVAYVNAYNSRNALQLSDLQAGDFRMVDHRPAGAGELDRDAARQYVEALWELVPKFCMYAERIVRLDPDGGVLTLRTVAETADGGPIEIHVAILAILDGGGTCVARFEIFAIEELAAAERRYDELTS